jgi:oligopeptidase B
MRLVRRAFFCACLFSLSACTTIQGMMPGGAQTGTTPQTATSTTPGLAIDRKTGFPPYAMMKGTVLIAPHGAKRTDYYFWLNEKNTEKVVRYLEEENKYANEAMSHTSDLQNTLRAEIKSRAASIQGTPAFKDSGYYYYERYAPGADFSTIARRKGAMTAPEEILLDGTSEGPKHDQFRVNNFGTSPDGTIFAYAADYSGDRWHSIVLRNTQTGAVLPDVLKYVASDFAFAADGKSLFYVRLQAGTARSYRLMRHVLGTDSKTDKLVYEEKDQQFELSLKKSKGGKLLLLTSEQTNTSEVLYLDLTNPESKWTVLKTRARGVVYHVEELGGQLYISTNQDAPDNKIMTAPLAQPKQWSEIVSTQRGVFISAFTVVKGVLALEEWTGGASRIRLHNLKTRVQSYIEPDAVGGFMSFADTANIPALYNTDVSAPALRYAFTSPVHPTVIYDYDVAAGTKKEVQRMSVVGFQPSAYALETSFASAPDGKQVPVTIAYRRDKFERGKSPVVLNAYGSYGVNNPPAFTAAWPSLMDRGFAVAFAHVRGGREMGDAWYQDGKLRSKKNSFTDFIAVADHLGKSGLADPKRVFAMGRSAGGLVMGAVANMRPELFKGVVATVPFVDVVTTMLDDSIPLTTGGYDEWGNPGEPGDYDYMQSYSPYDQVERHAYPAMLVTTAYNDSVVGYYGPAKWVAKLRRLKTDQNQLIFRTNMTAGHAGETGRFSAAEESSFAVAFLLDQAGLNPGNKPAKTN